jgi:hypothetical protein
MMCRSTVRLFAQMEKYRHTVAVDGTGREEAGFPKVSGVM